MPLDDEATAIMADAGNTSVLADNNPRPTNANDTTATANNNNGDTNSNTNNHASSLDGIEQSIRTMEESFVCLHPLHGHSFQVQRGWGLSPFHRPLCGGCHQRLAPMMTSSATQWMSNLAGGSGGGGSGGSGPQSTLRCHACGMWAHRACALGPDAADYWRDDVNKCTVNQPQTQMTMTQTTTITHCGVTIDEDLTWTSKGPPPPFSMPVVVSGTVTATTTNTTTASESGVLDSPAAAPPPAVATKVPPPQLFQQSSKEELHNLQKPVTMTLTTITPSNNDAIASSDPLLEQQQQHQQRSAAGLQENDSNDNNQNALEGLTETSETQTDDAQDDDDDKATSALHPALHPFSSISLALQENIGAHFQRRRERRDRRRRQRRAAAAAVSIPSVPDPQANDASSLAHPPHRPSNHTTSMDESEVSDDSSSSSSSSLSSHASDNTQHSHHGHDLSLSHDTSSSSSHEHDDDDVGPENHDGNSPKSHSSNSSNSNSNSSSQSSVREMVAQAAQTTLLLPKIGLVAVAGGIAGGVAGLALAGPAGACVGYQLGKAAGALGALLEGGVGLGVVVASVATATFTAQQLQDHFAEQQERKRILTMGEDGTLQKVLLVRPNIRIDPVWESISAEAKQSAPKGSSSGSGGGCGGLSTLLPTTTESANRECRYRRDEDIIYTREEELPTDEKVLLLVSRILNDKTSLPGHFYRRLIEVFRERCVHRETLVHTNESIAAVSSRARRDDTHAIIKHVTATLLQVRPGLAASSRLTELTATAVEALVFGQLYHSVFDEISVETQALDATLLDKVAAYFEAEATAMATTTMTTTAAVSLNEDAKETARVKTRAQLSSKQPAVGFDKDWISTRALEALCRLPDSHTAVDKLHYCVLFLEGISEHFNTFVGKGICADSLLKMVCMHVLQAKMDGINAQVCFLEEFARDGQLLRGREGYALVTLQAALHFLNQSTDFQADIFQEESSSSADHHASANVHVGMEDGGGGATTTASAKNNGLPVNAVTTKSGGSDPAVTEIAVDGQEKQEWIQAEDENGVIAVESSDDEEIL